jgi:hypothetical protein
MSECWGKMLVPRCCGELRGRGADERQRSNSLHHTGRAGGGRCSLLQEEEEQEIKLLSVKTSSSPSTGGNGGCRQARIEEKSGGLGAGGECCSVW